MVDRGIQTLKKDLATRVARKGGQWSDHFERAAGAYNARPHETVHGAPEDVEKQPATEFRVLQDNADKFQHNKDLTDRRVKAVQDAGAFRAPTNAARSFNPQYGDVQQLGAVDSMTVRSIPAEAGAAGAAGQRQRGGPADETQAGGCEAAGRLPGASEAQDPRLAFLDIARAGGEFPEPAQALFGLGFGVLGKPTGNQMSWRGQTVQNRAKKLLLQGVHTCRASSNSICSAKPCKTSYSYRPYIHVHPGRIALCGPKPCKCPFRVWGPRQTKRVGRTIEKRNPPGTLGRPVLKKKSETPPDPLGEPLKNETPPGPVGRTIEKRNPSRARWADH